MPIYGYNYIYVILALTYTKYSVYNNSVASQSLREELRESCMEFIQGSFLVMTILELDKKF